MDDLYLGENLSSLKLVNFMGEVIGCSVSLNGQLQLSDYLLINNDLKGNITYRNLFNKSVFNLF
jgi:hypothetical protein